MDMVEYQTLYYMMYREALEKVKEQEREKAAARDDEIKRQINRGSQGKTAVYSDDELRAMGLLPNNSVLEEDDVVNGTRPPQAYHPKSNYQESELEELMEEEGLL